MELCRRTFLKLGADDFLLKPFDAATLEAKVKKALQGPENGSPIPPAEQKLLAAGEKLVEQYRYDDAVKIYSKVLKDNPLQGHAYQGLARVFKLRNDKEKHRIFLRKAVRIHALTGKWEEAEVLRKELAKHFPEAAAEDGNPFAAAGWSHLEKGDGPAAAAAFARAAETEPGVLAHRSGLARALHVAGEDEKAMAAVVSVLLEKDDHEAGRELYTELAGESWNENPRSLAGALRAKAEEDFEKQGTVKFWTPDLMVGVKGRKRNMPIVAMSPSTVTFNLVQTEIAKGERIAFDILRMGEGDSSEMELGKLAGEITDASTQAARVTLDRELREERREEIMALITAAQARVKEQIRKAGDVRDFEVDMLFL